jgi:hypothetical protein
MHTVPRLPSSKKEFLASPPVRISPDHTREQIIDILSAMRHPASRIPHPASRIPDSASLVADLAFYAGRFMDSCDWAPFFKAAFERNPVSVEFFRDMELPGIFAELQSWPNESIYDSNRLALPDEVVNYRRGDGIEKAVTMVNVARARHIKITREQHPGQIILKVPGNKFVFHTSKNLLLPDLP